MNTYFCGGLDHRVTIEHYPLIEQYELELEADLQALRTAMEQVIHKLNVRSRLVREEA